LYLLYKFGQQWKNSPFSKGEAHKVPELIEKLLIFLRQTQVLLEVK